MAEKVNDYKCPACSGSMRYNGAAGKLKCDYCDSEFEVAEIEALYKEKEQRAQEAMAEENSSAWEVDTTADWGKDTANMKAYKCSACGAEMICDNNTAATCCPYCGSQTVIPGQFAGSLKPEYVIPFVKSKDDAIDALKKHYQGKKLLPKFFKEGNHIEEVQGVYVPFWLFDGQAKGEMRFHSKKEEKKKTATEEIITTHHYDVVRAGSLNFEKVPVDASSRMPDKHMDSIEPYDYKELKPFSTAYMPGYLADKYDVSADECGSRMEERCKNTLAKELTDTVEGYDVNIETERNLIVKRRDVHYALLPVWLLSTKYENTNYLFAMNGQSGKLVGDLPVDKGKFWGYFAAYALGLVAITLLLFNVILSIQMGTTATFVVVEIVIPIIIAYIIVHFMKGSLRSVFTPNAGNYIDAKGLSLTKKLDTFVKDTVERKPLNTQQK